MRHARRSSIWPYCLAPVALGAFACGGGEPDAKVPIAHESPEDEILGVAKVWESSTEDKGFRSAPSRITLFTTRATSTLTFKPGAKTAAENLAFDETFKLADGSAFQCQARADLVVPVAFGERAEEAAVEVRRNAVHLTRTCDRPGFPEPSLDLDAAAARFVFRGDQLVPVVPPTEARVYIPAP